MTEYIDTPFLDLSEQTPDLAEGLREFADALEGKSGVGADPEIRKLKAELRRVALRLMELEPEDQEGPEHLRLRKRYRELQKRLRELGGTPDRLPQGAREDSSEEDKLFADFAEQSGLANWLQSKGLDGEPRRTVDLSEREDEAQREGRPLFTADDLRRVAAEDTGELPESVRLDAELHDELRRQSHEDAFGGTEPGDDLSDAEAWAEYRRILGMEDAS